VKNNVFKIHKIKDDSTIFNVVSKVKFQILCKFDVSLTVHRR